MSDYRLAIFDFDGTIADSVPHLLAPLNQAAVRFGFRQVTEAELAVLRDQSVLERLRYLGVPLWKVPRIAVHMRRSVERTADGVALFPGAAELLQRLRDAGVVTAIVSSNAEATVRRVLGPAAGLVSQFSCGAALLGKAARIRTVLRRVGASRTSAIAVGDEGRDVEAARDAGVTAAAVTWGFATVRQLRAHAPDVTFDSIEELARHLLGSRSGSGAA